MPFFTIVSISDVTAPMMGDPCAAEQGSNTPSALAAGYLILLWMYDIEHGRLHSFALKTHFSHQVVILCKAFTIAVILTMKNLLQLVGSAALFSHSYALATLKPASIPHLTIVTNYTMYTLCERLQNPSLYFDEMVSISMDLVLARGLTILGIHRKFTL